MGARRLEAADDGLQVDDEEPAQEPEETWIQLSTDDSTSMASAQLYKSNSRRFSLKAHEFLNYYDPPARLFGEEGWSQQAEVGEDIRFGIKAVYQPLQDANENGNDRRPEAGVDLEEDPEDEDPQPQAPEDKPVAHAEISGHAEVLFQLRANRVAQDVRRNWNLFLCVDVSGSMRGEKIEYAAKR